MAFEREAAMKICGECRKTFWPFIIVFFFAGFISFFTWLTLASTGAEPMVIVAWTTGVFFLAIAVLLYNVVSCIKRHCRNSHEVQEH